MSADHQDPPSGPEAPVKRGRGRPRKTRLPEPFVYHPPKDPAPPVSGLSPADPAPAPDAEPAAASHPDQVVPPEVPAEAPARPPAGRMKPSAAPHYTPVGFKFDDELKAEFLRLYAATGQHNRSAAAIGINPETVRQHRMKFPEFGQAVAEAYRDFQESLETEALRRARSGTLEPVFQKGVKVGEIRRFSDQLLLEMLRRHIPEYRHRQQVDVNHTGGVLVVPEKAKDDADFITRFGGSPSAAAN